MTILTLRIENVATLENGGPVSLCLEGRGAQVGRKAGMDWVLPDATRHISGHHFDIAFEYGTYVLHDLSSNGTFLQGERYRLSEPRVLQQGDRLNVGHYVIAVDLAEHPLVAPEPAQHAAPATPQMPVAPPSAVPSPIAAQAHSAPSGGVDPFDDVWGDFGGAPMPPPVEPAPSGLSVPPHAPANAGASQSPDLNSLAGSPSPSELSVPPSFEQRSAEASLAVQSPQAWAAQTPADVAPPHMPAASTPAMPGMADDLHMPPPFTPSSLPEFTAPQPVAPAPYVQAEQAEGHGDAFLRGFLQGAGLQGPEQVQLQPEELGRILGQTMRDGTGEIIAMLQSRAAVKLFISGEDRTMRLAAGNNPMKFLPDAEQAFEAMFLAPRDGYMTGADAFRDALEDIRSHQDAVVAALQPALAEMLAGLSPEEVEETVGGGLVGGNGRKFWAEFKKRWEATAAQGENGMLDAFINAFSRQYSDAVRKG